MHYKISQAIAIAAAIFAGISTTLLRIVIYSDGPIFDSPLFNVYQIANFIGSIFQILTIVLVVIHLWRVPQQSLFGQKLRTVGIIIIGFPILSFAFIFLSNFIYEMSRDVGSLILINYVLTGVNIAIWGGLIAFSLNLPDTNAEEKNLKYSFIFLAVAMLLNFALSWVATFLYQNFRNPIPGAILLGIAGFAVGMMYFLILRRLSAWREVAIPKYQGDDDLLYKQQKMLDQPEQAAK